MLGGLIHRAPYALLVLLSASCLLIGGCDKAKTAASKLTAVVAKTAAPTPPPAESTATQDESERPPSLEDKRKEKLALEWRVIAVASAYAARNRTREDALGERFPWKVGIFEETTDNSYDRVTIDHDRDGEVDETWKWIDSRWTRHDGRVAWGGKDWMPAAGMAPGNARAPAAKGETTIYQRLAVAMRDQRATNYEVRDYLAGDGPLFDLKDTDWDARWDLAEVDKDRDGKVDETWTCHDGLVIRRVNATRKVFEFRNGDWVQRGAAKAAKPAP